MSNPRAWDVVKYREGQVEGGETGHTAVSIGIDWHRESPGIAGPVAFDPEDVCR